MVAPLVLAGIGILSSVVMGTAVALGLNQKFAVARFVEKQGRTKLTGKVFNDLESAKAWQETLAHQGYASIIVHCDESGNLDCMNPVKAMAPHPAGSGGRNIGKRKMNRYYPRTAQENIDANAGRGYDASEYGQRQPNLFPVIAGCESCSMDGAELGRRMRMVDTQDIYMNEMELTPKTPTPGWAKRAQDGPFFRTPDFRDTVSSHEWQTNVQTRTIPSKFYAGTKFDGRRA